MIQATLLQSLYNKLYKQLRKYIWDFKTVESLADFEIAVYQRFPEINDIEKAFFKLRRDIVNSPIYKDDEDLQYALDGFEKQLEDAERRLAEETGRIETYKNQFDIVRRSVGLIA